MSTPKVSIVCAYYNREDHVTDSIKSLLDQTYENFEIIVVNDGSTDSTLQKLEEFKDKRLKIITQENAGFTKAILNAIDNADGEYLAIHGSGDTCHAERIAKQVDVLQNKEEVGIVACHVEDDSNTGDFTYTLQIPNGLPLTETLMRQNIFEHGAVMLRRSVYEKVGGYRPFFIYAQDHDLWLRMSTVCDYHIVEEVLYRRFRRDDGVSRNTQKLLIQTYLVKFAAYCLREKLDTGIDPLEKVGPHAAFLMPPSYQLAKAIMWLGMLQMLDDNLDGGWDLMWRGANECFSIKIWPIAIIGMTHKNKLLWSKIGKPAYRYIYSRHLKRSGQESKV